MVSAFVVFSFGESEMRIDILLVGIFIIAWGICGSITAFRDRKKFLGEMTETVNAVVDKVYYRWSRSGAGYFVVWKYSFRGKRYTSEELATALIVPVFEVGEKRKILVNTRNPRIVSGSKIRAYHRMLILSIFTVILGVSHIFLLTYFNL